MTIAKHRMLTGSIQLFVYKIDKNYIKYAVGVFYPTPTSTTTITDVDTQLCYTVRVPPEIQTAKGPSYQLDGTLELAIQSHDKTLTAAAV